MCNDKWHYIGKISQLSREYHAEYMINMLDKYNKNNLQEITLNEAKEFYEELICKISSIKNVGHSYGYYNLLINRKDKNEDTV